MLRQDGPLRTPLSGSTTLTLIRLQVLRSCLFEPTVFCWFIIGPDRQRFQLGVFGITFPKRSTQCRVTYSENKGYASNPRRFVSFLFCFHPIMGLLFSSPVGCCFSLFLLKFSVDLYFCY